MLISIKWLEEFLKKEIDASNLEKVCLNLGLEVEDTMKYAPEGVVIGKITAISPHPREKGLDVYI